VLEVQYACGCVSLENGASYSWTIDGSGNRKSITLGADIYHQNQTTSWTWDSQHNMLTEVTGTNRTWTYTYDSRGNRLTVVGPDSVTKETDTFDSLNHPLT